MNKLENDIPKYKKKKESSVSKSGSKSKHKHEYVECLFINHEKAKPYPNRGSYCKICGKIGDIFFDTIVDNIGRRMMTDDEVWEKYKDLEQIHIDSFWQKYAPINKGGE